MSSPGTSAAPAPSGIASFLNGIPAPTTTSSSTQYPQWLQDSIKSVIQAGGALAQQPFNPFPGPLVAAPSTQTTQAQTLAGQNVGNYQPALNQAQGAVGAGTNPISQDQINSFINPFTNYVTGALNTNLQQNILPGIQDKFVSAGQSRSPQEAQLTDQAVYGTQQAAGQAIAGGYQGALNSALQQQQQNTNAGNVLGQLGSLRSTLGAADVGQLAASGATQDQLAQQNINAALNQFQQQTQYPYQQVGFLSDLIRGVPLAATSPTSTQITSGNTFAPSPLATFAGTLAGSNSLGGGGGTGLARGGRVIPLRHRIGALEQMRMAA